MTAPYRLDELTHRGWPALESVEVDGWLVRLAQGVTQRANSVLPLRAPRDLSAAVEEVERIYRQRGLTPTFQISPAAQPAGLDDLLADRGYAVRTPTVIQVADVSTALRRLLTSAVAASVETAPDEDWMRLWWSIDGRGGAQARAVASRLLTGGPALYGSIRDSTGVTAVARLALVEEWAGVFCMAVRPDARRRGYGRAVLRTLLEQAASHGATRAWLQVLDGNHGARALYGDAGFAAASSYHYRSASSP
ncbi:MAG: GNAT family N-acetyltransferase [Mycobacteriales bacterium]